MERHKDLAEDTVLIKMLLQSGDLVLAKNPTYERGNKLEHKCTPYQLEKHSASRPL